VGISLLAVACGAASAPAGKSADDATVTHSNQIEDRDVGGEISTSDGKIIYKAELVDMGRGTPSGVATRE
jgi:hypothetical protein